jgi:EmrB/QacA subfamily drug resistance transporter
VTLTRSAPPAVPAPSPAPRYTHRQILAMFAGLILGMLLAALDGTIVATALPRITGELGGLNHLSWVVTAYLLTATISTPLYGKLGDLFGRGRLFQWAIVVFLIGSVLCGLSQSMLQLVAFRAIQGLGAGGLIVLGQAIIAEVVSPRERGRYQGYFGAVFGAASVAGPLLGGFITDHMSWRWVFYVNLPLGLLALAVTMLVLPAGQRHGNPRIDYAGSAILAAFVTTVVLLTTWGGTTYGWTSAPIAALVALAGALLGLLIHVERQAAEAVVPLHLFSMRTFKITSTVSFIVGIAMYGAIAFLPLFVQVVNGASATDSGLVILPLMAGMIGASMTAGQITARTGRYKVFPIVGTAVAAFGLVLLSTMGTDTSRMTVSVYMVLLGAGIGLTMQTLILSTQNAVRTADLGVATSSVTFFRSMGGSIGVALFGALFNSSLRHHLASIPGAIGGGRASFTPEAVQHLPLQARTTFVAGFADALTHVFLYAVPVMLVGFAISWLLREVPLRDTTHDAVDHELLV